MAASELQRWNVFYSGHVQGVGFRFTTRKIASSYDVTGFVRNLADGRVEMVVEGQKETLCELTHELMQAMGDFIREQSVDVQPATGEFSGFEIRH